MCACKTMYLGTYMTLSKSLTFCVIELSKFQIKSWILDPPNIAGDFFTVLGLCCTENEESWQLNKIFMAHRLADTCTHLSDGRTHLIWISFSPIWGICQLPGRHGSHVLSLRFSFFRYENSTAEVLRLCVYCGMQDYYVICLLTYIISTFRLSKLQNYLFTCIS